MSSYYYKCESCERVFLPNEIEDNFIYLCPQCGKANKNEPLGGVLTVLYDYEKIAEENAEELLFLEPGKIWHYPNLWPVDFSKFTLNDLDKITLPSKIINKYRLRGKEIFIQDETRNPTLSYKDRASILVALKAMELGVGEIAAASTGNAGSSLAGICARLGLTSRIYVPKNIPLAKRIQIEAYGAQLEVVEGDYDLAFDKCLEDSLNNNWYNRNTAYNPLTIEGKKSGAYDMFIELEGKLPDYIFVPVGDGVIISGLYKGLWELSVMGWINRIPKLIAVQAEGSDAVVRYLSESTFNYKPAATIADSISAGAPRNLYMAANSVKNTNGFGITVSDEEITIAQKEFIQQTGILCEPSSAAVYAGYIKALEKNMLNKRSSILLLMTGNGLKDLESLKNIIQ